ncbi:MAG: helix-turn-helix transcriptional regulator [Fluviicola sp.]|nr:helix-turn-helix transcriptional regulator [Fluviicola sp.]
MARLFVALLLFCTINSWAQNLTCKKALTLLNSELTQSKEPTITCLYFFRNVGEQRFINTSEWKKSLYHIERIASTSRGTYYVQLCTEIGTQLSLKSNHNEAYYFLYKARTSIKSHPQKDKRFLKSYHQTIGLSYYHFKCYYLARKHLNIVNSFSGLDDRERIGVLNTIGLINRDQGYSDSSKFYFEKALKIAQKLNHTPWIGVLSGNLGHYYWSKNQLSDARKLLETDYRLSMLNHQAESALNALSILILIDLKEGKKEAARTKIKLFKPLQSSNLSLSSKRLCLNAILSLQEADADYKGAFESYRQITRYTDIINQSKDLKNIRQTAFKIDFERKRIENRLLNSKKKNSELLAKSFIVVSILIIILFFVFLLFNRKRRIREREIATLKHQQIEKELLSSENEMHLILSKLIEKNELIEHLLEEINRVPHSSQESNSEERSQLLEKIQSYSLVTDDQWFAFKKVFEKLNPNFYGRLFDIKPDLTNAEIRLLTLIKLNLSNMEMAKALGISADSVRKTSLRLRKKLGMNAQEDLVRLVLSL